MNRNLCGVLMAGVLFLGIGFGDARAQGFRQGGEPGGARAKRDLPAAARDFDFMIGKWNIQQVGGGTATDTIKSFGRGVAITEKMRAPNFEASTVTVFDVTTGLWTQTYLDNQGLYAQQTGGREGEEVVLVGPSIDSNGNQHLTRLRYLNITARSFEQIGEDSADGGATWVESFRLQFRKASSSKE